MGAVKWIVVWSAVATLSAIAGALLASFKNRNGSTWAAWGFLLPPSVLVLMLLPRHRGPRPVQPSLDEEDRRMEYP
jgi:hypothetical protein